MFSGDPGRILSALGYGLDEIKGRHHSMFVEASRVTAATTASSGATWGKAGSNPEPTNG
jgi:hypothetical protein